MIESARNEKSENRPGSARVSFILKTIRQPIEARVDAAPEVLLDTKRHPNREPVLRLVPIQLVERTSTRLAAAGRP
jgi:DNA-binding LacI/PurR family transcriptional regulator